MSKLYGGKSAIRTSGVKRGASADRQNNKVCPVRALRARPDSLAVTLVVMPYLNRDRATSRNQRVCDDTQACVSSAKLSHSRRNLQRYLRIDGAGSSAQMAIVSSLRTRAPTTALLFRCMALGTQGRAWTLPCEPLIILLPNHEPKVLLQPVCLQSTFRHQLSLQKYLKKSAQHCPLGNESVMRCDYCQPLLSIVTNGSEHAQ